MVLNLGLLDRFRKKPILDKTIVQIQKSTLTESTSIYLEAQTYEKAVKLMDKFKLGENEG